jgi:RHS repeat-associated protein
MSIARFHHDWRARLVAFVTLTTFLASLLPARTAHADVAGGGVIAPQGTGLSDGSAGLSTATGSPDNPSGDARTSYTFQLPKARGDAQPSLGLTYSSSAGVGFAGVGWTLSLPSIVRKGVAGVPKFRDEVPTNATSDDFYIDGALLIPVQTNPPLPAAIPPVAIPTAVNHPWVLYRREIDDGCRYFYDGLTWVQQCKTEMRQFGVPLDGGTASIEVADAFSGAAFVNAGSNAEDTFDLPIYRWNLVRDTDTSGNTVYYVWHNEAKLLGVNPRTAGTMFLTDIYDTSNTPNPTPPGPRFPGQCSAQTATQACGNCGTQTGTCANGVWTWGACENEGVCSAGSLQACGTGGAQSCNSQCQWDACMGQSCPGDNVDGGQTTQPCGTNGCGVSVGTCDNGTWSWGACQQPANSCSPGTVRSCSGRETQTCTSMCTWGPCTCTPGTTQSCSIPGGDSSCPAGTQTCQPSNTWGPCVPPANACTPGSTTACPSGVNGNQTCTSSCTWPGCQITGSLLDDFVGLFEGNAYAQTSGGSSPTAFAHHTHLTWALPNFPVYPTAVTFSPGVVGPYAFSPIWKAPPFAQLTTVDVFSATTTTDRQLVREYQLSYTPNPTQTRTYLTSIQLVGDCDSVGGISESHMPGNIGTCVLTENIPPTTFSYYGIGNVTDPLPTILSETAAYAPTKGPADFLADLNGDAIDDLVCGWNGAQAVTQCLIKYESEGIDQLCPINEGQKFLTEMTFGFYSAKANCKCPAGSQVTGPAQDAGHTFSTSSNGSLTTYTADDSMWSFSVYADWAATGRTSFLQVLPPLPLQPQLFSGGYTNTDPQGVRLSQLSDPSSSQTTLEDLSGQLQNDDQYNLGQQINMTGGAYCNYGFTGCNNTNVAPYNAMDVDGDGLPDMAGLDWGPNNTPVGGFSPNTTMLSTRDRNGVTHPFAVQTQHLWTKWELPGWAWDQPGWGGSWGDYIAGGTYYAIFTTGNFPPYTQQLMFTSAVHAGADIDGDGLADKVAVNKFRKDWNQTMYQTVRGNLHDYKDQGAFDGPFSYVGMVVLPNRGDGRFGVPSGSYVSSPDIASGYDWGNYVTPGAVAPFSPYTYPGDFDGKPPYTASGRAPLPQSDNLEPSAPEGWSMQGSVIRFGDLNGDGMADYAVLDPYGVHICLRHGGPWDAAHWSCVTEPIYFGDNQTIVTNPHATIMIGDVNGSGINRVIYFPAPTTALGTPGQATAILVSPDGSTKDGPRDGLLQTMSNGLGAQTTYTYSTINSLGIGHIPVPAWVVTSATTTNALTGTQAVARTTQYSYGEPIYDARAQMFVGFRSVTATTLDASGASPGIRTKTTFATQTDNTCAGIICAGVAEAMIHASRFLPAVVETSEIVDGAVRRRFTTTVYSYNYQSAYKALDSPIPAGPAGLSEAPARPGMTLVLRTTLTYPWNAGDSGVSQFVPPTLTFTNPPNAAGQLGVDAAFMLPSTPAFIKHQGVFDVKTGNEVLTQDFGVAGSDVPIIAQSTWELPPGDTTGWDYRVEQTLTGYADPTGSTLDESKPYRELDYAYDAAGRVRTVKSPLTNAVPLPGPGGAAFAAGQPPTAAANGTSITLQSFLYDGFGNVTQVGNQDYPCARTVSYDTLFAQLPATITDFPNGCGNPGGLVSNLTFDRRLDAEKSRMDPSGSLTLLSYDDFGRVAELDKPAIDTPGATTKVFAAQYTDRAPIHQVHYQTGYGLDSGGPSAPGYLDHYQYIDSFGETKATLDAVDPNAHMGVKWVISGVHTSYINGRVAATYRPFPSNGPAAAGALPAEVGSPQGPSATFFYDGMGRVLESTDYQGNTASIYYHDANLSRTYVDPQQATDGSSTTVTTDGHGRVVTQDVHLTNGPTGSPGDLITTAKYLASGETQNVTQEFPGGSFSRTLVYDSLGRLVQNTEPNVGTWTYAYDAEGRVVGTSDARGCGQNIFYDAIGRVLARDYSPCTSAQAPYTKYVAKSGVFPYPGAEVSYQYDSAGRLSAVADRARNDAYSYHAAGYIQAISRKLAAQDAWAPAPEPIVYHQPHTKFFDQYTVDGKLMRSGVTSSALANPAGGQVTETTSYTSDGRVYQVASSLSGTIIAGQQFNPDGSVHQTDFGDAASTVASLGYDGNGRMSSYALMRKPGPWVTNYASGFAPPPILDPSCIGELTILGIFRDKVGNPTNIGDSSAAFWPAGMKATRIQASYYDDYRLKSVSVSPGDSFSDPYAYEASIGSSQYPQPTTPSTNARLRSLSLSYDWRGNITSSVDDASDFFDRSLGTVTSSADRLMSATGAGSSNPLLTQYDAAGNLTQIEVNDANSTNYAYQWDEVGNLAAASRADASGGWGQRYAYTDSGERMFINTPVYRCAPVCMKQTMSTVNVFDSQVLKNAPYDVASADYGDSPTTEEVYVGGGLARVFSDSRMPRITSDGNSLHTFLNLPTYNGSGAFVIDKDTGELVERTAYMPFGAIDADFRAKRWQSPREDIKYTGHWDNAEVGLVYFGARYYSPQLGRFISPDPLAIHGLGGDLNPYEYAYGNPIANTDPDGLNPLGGGCDGPQGCGPAPSNEWTPPPATFDDWPIPATDTTALANNTLGGAGGGGGGASVGISMGGCGEGGCVADWDNTVPPDFGSQNLPSWMTAPGMSAAASSFLDEAETYNALEASPGQEVNYSTQELASTMDARIQAQHDAYIQDQIAVNGTVMMLGSFSTIFGAVGRMAAEAAPTLAADADALAQFGARVPTQSGGYFNVVTHANATSAYVVRGGDWAAISHRTLAQFIEGAPGYGGGPVRLIACEAGACATGLARNLANKMGVEVLAPTEKAFVDAGGNYWTTGSWLSFTPGRP